MKLIANIGGEEKSVKAMPGPARQAAVLWSFIFPETSDIIEPSSVNRPLSHGYDLRQSAFPILDNENAWAWINTLPAETLARPERLGGSASAIVEQCHDKAFLHNDSYHGYLDNQELRNATRVLKFSPSECGMFHEDLIKATDNLPDWQCGFLRMKPRLGSTGRKHLTFRPHDISTEDLSDAINKANGGVVIEPELERVEDYSLQAFIRPSGTPEIIGILKQHTNKSGKFLGHSGLLENGQFISIRNNFTKKIREEGIRILEDVAACGYRGPCGIDSFSFRGPNGRLILRPAVEFNARFTMGIVTIGILHRLLESREAGGVKSFGNGQFTASYDKTLIGGGIHKIISSQSGLTFYFEPEK